MQPGANSNDIQQPRRHGPRASVQRENYLHGRLIVTVEVNMHTMDFHQEGKQTSMHSLQVFQTNVATHQALGEFPQDLAALADGTPEQPQCIGAQCYKLA